MRGEEHMGKSVEYVLTATTVGAMMMAVGSLSWTGFVKLASVFTDIAQALQV